MMSPLRHCHNKLLFTLCLQEAIYCLDMSHILAKSQPAEVTAKSEFRDDDVTLKNSPPCDLNEQIKTPAPPSPIFFSRRGEIITSVEVAIDVNSNLRFVHLQKFSLDNLFFF